MLRRSISVLARASAPAPAAAASITPAEGFTLGAAVCIARRNFSWRPATRSITKSMAALPSPTRFRAAYTVAGIKFDARYHSTDIPGIDEVFNLTVSKRFDFSGS